MQLFIFLFLLGVAVPQVEALMLGIVLGTVPERWVEDGWEWISRKMSEMLHQWISEPISGIRMFFKFDIYKWRSYVMFKCIWKRRVFSPKLWRCFREMISQDNPWDSRSSLFSLTSGLVLTRVAGDWLFRMVHISANLSWWIDIWIINMESWAW